MAGRPPVHLFVSGCPAPEHRRVRRLSDRPFTEIRDYLAGLGGTSAEVLAEPELMSLLEPALRADLAIVESYEYHPGPRLTCPITVLTGDDDPVTADRDAVAAWRGHSTGAFRRHRYPGDHAFPLACQEQLMRDVAAELDVGAAINPMAHNGGES